jgi:hypothetical protein
MTLELYLSLASGQLVSAITPGSAPIAAAATKRGITTVILRLQERTFPVAPADLVLALKPPGQHDAPLSAQADEWDWDARLQGFRAELSTLTTPIDAAFAVDGDPTNDVASVSLMAELAWRYPGPDELDPPGPWLRTQTISLALGNNVFRGDEESAPPAAVGAAWEWLKARLIAGSGITITADDEAQTLTITTD